MAFLIRTATNVLTLLFSPITALFTTLILPLLPSHLRIQLILLKDVTISVANIVFGRLLQPQIVKPMNLAGKTAIVTGSNSGIGLQIASDLAQQGATIILACRSHSKALAAQSTLHSRIPTSKGRIHILSLDTSSKTSIEAFTKSYLYLPLPTSKIDILIHNAGIATLPSGTVPMSTDNLEQTYMTNHLGAFLLTHLLEPHLSPTARIVFTSSTGQYESPSQRRFSRDFLLGPVLGVAEPGFHFPIPHSRRHGVEIGWERKFDDAAGRYGNSKAMQCAFARCLQMKWDSEKDRRARGRTAHSFSPGFTATPIFDKIDSEDRSFTIFKTVIGLAVGVEEGAKTGVWLASTEDPGVVGEGAGGGYWDRMVRRLSTADLLDEEMLRRFWARWEADAGVVWPWGMGKEL